MDEKKFELLNQIVYPSDLQKLSVGQLPEVCKELREDIIEKVSVNPGHLASSLGVVELTVALHYVFNTPDDRIVWDVGHQAYVHFPHQKKANTIPLPAGMPQTAFRQPLAWPLPHVKQDTRGVMWWQ